MHSNFIKHVPVMKSIQNVRETAFKQGFIFIKKVIKGEIINLDNKILINETSISIKCRKISNTAETIHYFFVIAYENNL